jgi:hypothetical protein
MSPLLARTKIACAVTALNPLAWLAAFPFNSSVVPVIPRIDVRRRTLRLLAAKLVHGKLPKVPLKVLRVCSAWHARVFEQPKLIAALLAGVVAEPFKRLQKLKLTTTGAYEHEAVLRAVVNKTVPLAIPYTANGPLVCSPALCKLVLLRVVIRIKQYKEKFP